MKGKKVADRNVEIWASVCDETGRPVSPGMIYAHSPAAITSPNSGGSSYVKGPLTVYKSVVYYHEGMYFFLIYCTIFIRKFSNFHGLIFS